MSACRNDPAGVAENVVVHLVALILLEEIKSPTATDTAEANDDLYGTGSALTKQGAIGLSHRTIIALAPHLLIV